MREPPETTVATANKPSVGQLCIGGDWACAHGDFETLQFVARSLAELAPERVRKEVADLAQRCVADPEHAAEAWVDLKARVARWEWL